MTIASQIQDYADGLSDAYDMVAQRGGTMPQRKNMQNLDTAIATIPSGGVTYTAGYGITIDSGTNEIAVDTTKISSKTIWYVKALIDPISGEPTVDWTTIYRDSAYTDPVRATEVPGALTDGAVLIAWDASLGSWCMPMYSTIEEAADFDPNCAGSPGGPGVVINTVSIVGIPQRLLLSAASPTDTVWTVTDLSSQEKLTAGSNITISNNVISATDTTYSDFTGATSSTAGANGLVPAPAAGDQNKALKGDGTWGDFSEEFVIMKYGEANAWAKFIDAYNKKKIVYCRASSNSNPATGAQTRLAFMAYVSNETNPTNVEFQYVRSVGTKTSSQPVDQVFVYKLESTNGGTWSVQTRDMAPKIAAGTGINVSYSNGTYTISLA